MLKPLLIALGSLYLAGHFYVYHVKPQPTPKQKYYVAGNFYYCNSQDEKWEQQRTASVSNECKSVKRLEAIEGLDLSAIKALACEVQS